MEEKKFDVNSFIGMILIGGILLWWMNSNTTRDYPNTETTTEQVINSENTASQLMQQYATCYESDSLNKLISKSIRCFC